MSLDQVGRAQAAGAARALSVMAPVRLWSSDLVRARETADLVAGRTGLRVETSSAFREYSVGERSGLTLAEFEERFPAEYAAWRAGRRTPAGAESDEDVLARFVPALRDALDALGPGECGVVVTHGAAVKTALLDLLGLPSSARDAFGVLGNGRWVELRHAESTFLGGGPRWRIAGYNLAADPDLDPPPDFASAEPVG